MKYPKYEITSFSNGHKKYITECCFGMLGMDGSPIMVGSLACERCKYFKHNDKRNSIVYCSIK